MIEHWFRSFKIDLRCEMKESINAITNFIFVRNDIKKSDLIIMPGTSREVIPERAASLYMHGYAPFVVTSGLYSSKREAFASEHIEKTALYGNNYSSESDFMYQVLVCNGVPSTAIISEFSSRNTLENAEFSYKMIRLRNMKHRRIIVCCQAFHARRVLMTYAKVFNNSEILIDPVITQGIGSDDWHRNEYSVNRVMDELVKCGKYFVKDIVVSCIREYR
jgi:uncharacterized SAM-binding protein YcdF (DUF218 family)